MIYPEVSLDEWFKKYPALKGDMKCICGSMRSPLRPWISKDYAGIETGPCESCKRPNASKSVYRSAAKNAEMLSKLFT